MKIIAIFLLFITGCAAVSIPPDPPIPLVSGDYEFTHRFAEHPTIPSIRVNVHISGAHVTVINPTASDPFPAGVLAEGTLMWHAASKQWIIGNSDSDKFLRDVGGCSDGPEVIDFVAKTYWTC